MNTITYRQQGDYQVANLTYGEELLTEPYGRYGAMRKEWLQENHRKYYTLLVLNGQLWKHLHEREQATIQAVEARVSALMAVEKNPPNQTNQPMEWVALMDSLTKQAETELLPQIIFVK